METIAKTNVFVSARPVQIDYLYLQRLFIFVNRFQQSAFCLALAASNRFLLQNAWIEAEKIRNDFFFGGVWPLA